MPRLALAEPACPMDCFREHASMNTFEMSTIRLSIQLSTIHPGTLS
jgi:hypothetical protein